MATASVMRSWLADNGHPEIRGGRGRLAADLVSEYEQAHGPPADDYGPGTSPADFLEADDPGPPADAPGGPQGDAEPPGLADGLPPAQAEERPRRPRAARPRLPWARRPGTQGRARPPKRERKRWPRVSVAPLIEDAYADMAWAAAAIPPLQRLLYAQAPVAGVILDPVVKDTVADRVLLQPAARNYERMKVGMALVGTPAALFTVLATAPQPVIENGRIAVTTVAGPDGKPVEMPVTEPPSMQHKTAMVSFRYCVRAMADLSGDALERVSERVESNQERDEAVDRFIADILGTAAPADERETARRSGAAAGLRLAGAS